MAIGTIQRKQQQTALLLSSLLRDKGQGKQGRLTSMLRTSTFLYLSLAMSAFMITRRTFATTTKRVAVLGCGVAGSNFVREFMRYQDENLKIDVYDAGRSPGGRASSMSNEYGTWDMGAQYISKPRTEDFNEVLKDWLERGIIKEWHARMLDCSDRIESTQIDDYKTCFVGVPSMQSICELVEHDGLSVTSNCSVDCRYDRIKSVWRLINRNTKQVLGDYDWIVCTDRPNTEQILSKNGILGKEEGRTKSRYSTTLSCMIAVQNIKREQVPFDAVKLHNHPVLSYISIESSKPDRQDKQGEEIMSITLQSSEKFAKGLIESATKAWKIESKQKTKTEGDKAFWSLRIAINKACEKPMYDAFYDLVSASKLSFPKEAIYARGFRWGRSFPINSWKGSYMLQKDDRMLMVGDYFDINETGEIGRIETSVVSARRGAQALRKEILTTTI